MYHRKMPRHRIQTSCQLIFVILVGLIGKPLVADEGHPREVANWTQGPEKGTLVIQGGSGDEIAPASGESYRTLIFKKFVELAGGHDIRLVIVPTAQSGNVVEHEKTIALARKTMKMPHVTILHTRDREVADTDEFIAPLKTAQAVWFTGGRQWRTAKVYLGTQTEKEFHKILSRGGVIGGTSAGASVQGSFLVRGAVRGNNILIGDYREGFGFIRNSAIDQHVIARSREEGLTKILISSQDNFPQGIDRDKLLGIGIDEDSAIVVRGNELEVIGKPNAQVLIYDPMKWTDQTTTQERYEVLRLADRYDLSLRKRIHHSYENRE